MRRGLLALGIGLVIAAVVFGVGAIRFTRPIPNGTEVISFSAAYPAFLYFSIPGTALMWLVAFMLQAKWASSQFALQLLVVAGDAIFYSLAAYVVLRLVAKRRPT